MIFHRFTAANTPPVWLVWCLIMALALRGFIPVGFMPGTGGNSDSLLALTICSGSGPQTIFVTHGHRVNPSQPADQDQQKAHDHATCPFSITPVFPFNAPPLVFPPLRFAVLVLLALTGFGLIRHRRFSNASSRSPPFYT